MITTASTPLIKNSEHKRAKWNPLFGTKILVLVAAVACVSFYGGMSYQSNVSQMPVGQGIVAAITEGGVGGRPFVSLTGTSEVTQQQVGEDKDKIKDAAKDTTKDAKDTTKDAKDKDTTKDAKTKDAKDKDKTPADDSKDHKVEVVKLTKDSKVTALEPKEGEPLKVKLDDKDMKVKDIELPEGKSLIKGKEDEIKKGGLPGWEKLVQDSKDGGYTLKVEPATGRASLQKH